MCSHLWVSRQVQDSVQPLAVVVPGLLLVDHVSVVLRQGQEPPDGAQVLPQGPVLRAGVLLPAQQITQPALEREEEIGSVSCRERV